MWAWYITVMLIALWISFFIYGSIVRPARKWKKLERWAIQKAEHHERMMQYTGERTTAYIIHRAQLSAMDEVLIAMDQIERGEEPRPYELRLAPEVALGGKGH